MAKKGTTDHLQEFDLEKMMSGYNSKTKTDFIFNVQLVNGIDKNIKTISYYVVKIN